MNIKDGTPYFPSNGTEGMEFTGKYCDNCKHQNPNPNKKPECDTLIESFLGYSPIQWIYKNNQPICTKFHRYDWRNMKEPEEQYISTDPNQLSLFPNQ